MGLFDIFTFKKEAGKVFSSENILGLINLAKDKIIEQVKDKIKGEEKKAIVDYFVIKFIEDKAKGCKNKYVLWLIDRIKEEVPKITQKIYDLLKEKVENL